GRKILFESGDLLFIAGKKSRIWRAIPNEIGLAVLQAASHFTSEVAQSDMIAFAPEVIEDFEYALELLQLDLRDFPVTERLLAKETALDTRALDELVWVPAIASSQEFSAFVKAGGEIGPALERLINYLAQVMADWEKSKKERDHAL